jgi:hypothetical protein
MKLLCVFLLAATAAVPQGRRPRVPAGASPEFPPDIVIGTYADVLKAAPRFYAVEMENERTRVLRAKLPAHGAVPAYIEHSGLLVAVSDVHQFRTTDDRRQEITVPAGATHWVDGDTHSVENASSRACEFLFIEMKR